MTKRANWLIAVAVSAVIIVFASLTALSWWVRQIDSPLALESEVFLTVEHGTTASSLLREIHEKYLSGQSIVALKVWLKLNSHYVDIKAGTYRFLPGATIESVFQTLMLGKEHQFPVTLVEGLTFRQWLKSLEQHPVLHYDWDAQTESQLLALWNNSHNGEKVVSLEGVFLSDTYYVSQGTPVSELLERAMTSMIAFLDSKWSLRDLSLPLQTPYEVLVLASIVEKETAVPLERPHIAGVFVNRLHRNMRLQTDPTVIYGVGPLFDGDITRKHLRTPTPYNTYVIKGLTPTPIAMTGREAINSVLLPKITEDLYFVSKGDGTHHFSSTLAQHNAAVKKYQLKQ